MFFESHKVALSFAHNIMEPKTYMKSPQPKEAPSDLTELKNKMRSFFSTCQTLVTRPIVNTKSQRKT